MSVNVAGRPLRRHVVADVVGVRAELLDDLDALADGLTAECVAGGATVLGVLSHRFDPQGVTVLVLLAESHASIHTWPEYGTACVDVFTCGDVAPAPIVDGVVRMLGGFAVPADVSEAAAIP